MIDSVNIRAATQADAAALAALHAEAWRYAYRGIIPGVALERMIARHGPAWWEAAMAAGMGALVLEFDGQIVGYTTLGRCRGRKFPTFGEIYELYLKPEFHGSGFGRHLFEVARKRLKAAYPGGLLVWALAENEIGCRFYETLGGREVMRSHEFFDGKRLEKVCYRWR